jgi:hypothetical protein
LKSEGKKRLLAKFACTSLNASNSCEELPSRKTRRVAHHELLFATTPSQPVAQERKKELISFRNRRGG